MMKIKVVILPQFGQRHFIDSSFKKENNHLRILIHDEYMKFSTIILALLFHLIELPRTIPARMVLCINFKVYRLSMKQSNK